LTVDSIIHNAKAYAQDAIVDCSIAVEEGRIWKIGRETNMPKADAKTDMKGLLVLPGLVDPHVHLRDEGKAYKEDFLTGTAAAAAGGFATILDMPNNDPLTMSAESLGNRIRKAENRILVNVGFFSEFPKEMRDIEEIVNEGAVAFKLFMAEQVGGLDLDDDSAMLEGFKIVSGLKGLVAVHAEDKVMLEAVVGEQKRCRHDDVEAFLKAHSEEVEAKAVNRMLSLSREARLHAHFCHVSTKQALRSIAEAKITGPSVSCETTPHNLLLTSDDLKRMGALALTVPPVRDRSHVEALWNGIKSGAIDIIGSDHAPHTLEEKQATSVWNVKTGIPGLETTLPLLLTEVRRGRLSVGDVVKLMAERPAGIYGLKGKGFLKAGSDADFTVIDLNRKHKIDASKFKSKAKYSPFDGWPVVGKPVKTFVGGELVFDEGRIVAKPGCGRIVRRA
jgi:dihydroorotase